MKKTYKNWIRMSLIGMAAFFSLSAVSFAAAPTGSVASLQNPPSSQDTTVGIALTGTDFALFVNSGSTSANATDLLGITYAGQHPTGANIMNGTTLAATFAITGGTAIQTSKSGGSFTINAGIVQDGGATPNLAITIADGSITDGAKPVLLTAVVSNDGDRNKITLHYSEVVAFNDGASTTTSGDLTTAGTLAGIATFAGGNSTVPTTKNTLSGNGTTNLIVTFANQAGGYFNSTSTTELSGAVTPVASAALSDVNSNQAQVTNVAPTVSGGGAWDLTKPTLTTITVTDSSSNNGKLDRAVLVFNSIMRGANVTSADATLNGLAGTFTGATDTTSYTFNLTTDASQSVDTSISTAASQLLYSASTTKLIDKAGNLLNTTAVGTIAATDATIGNGKLVDNAKPILVSAVKGVNNSGQNIVTLTYSEPMYIDNTNQDGTVDAGDYTSNETFTSTVVIGDTDSAGSLEKVGAFSNIGSVTQSVETSNTLAVASNGLSITVAYNTTANSYFTNSETAPSGDFTPSSLTYLMAQSPSSGTTYKIANASATAPTSSGSWDLTTTSIPTSFQKTDMVSATSDAYSWGAVGGANKYIIFMSATDITLANSTSATAWKSTDDSALATSTTQKTTITGLPGATNYVVRLASIDAAGNVALTSQLAETTGQGPSGRVSVAKADTTSPSKPTDLSAKISTSLKVVLSWKNPADSDFKNVQVLKSTNGKSYNVIALLDNSSVTYTDGNVSSGDVVSYEVVALDGSGNASDSSSAVSVTVKAGEVVKAVTDSTATDTTVDNPSKDTNSSDKETLNPASTPIKLSDIEKSWAKTEIEKMTEKGIVKGNKDGTFKPENFLNKADAAVLICRVMKIDEMKAVDTDPATDVKKADYFGSCVSQLKSEKVVTGNPDGTYTPGKDANRAEFIALALRAYGTLLKDQAKTDFDASMTAATPKASFKDVNGKDWYANVAATAKDNKFVNGRDGNFDGAKSITRAEATTVLYRIFKDLL